MTTITHEQAQSLAGFKTLDEVIERLKAIGITVAPPEPPEAMVKLADEATERLFPGWNTSVSSYLFFRDGYVAALQHAAKVVRDADYHANLEEMRDSILRQLGAIE